MAAIHLVDRTDNLRRLKNSSIAHEWECSGCAIDQAVAEKLVGADLFVHEGMARPSLFGGKITGFRIDPAAQVEGSVIFRFQATNEHRNVKTSRAGWINHTKILW